MYETREKVTVKKEPFSNWFDRCASGLNLKLILRNIWRNSSINHQRLPSIQACSFIKNYMLARIYVVVNFLFQVIFIFLLFLGMVIYANKVETKEK